jgi:hypothetical protein
MNKTEKSLLINQIESELKSFEAEKLESKEVINSDKKRIIDDVRSGSFDEMLLEIENREANKKKENFLDKLFKLF